jgi:3-mercaptopyruvate sulfurtransferase SseA
MIAMRQVLAVVVAAALLHGAAAPAAPPDYPVAFVKVDEVKSLLDRGVAVDLIDVRTPPEFDEEHIQGARSIPLRTLGQRLGEVPKNRLVVFY